MAKPAQALIGERTGINSFHGRARATLRASWAFLWLPQDRKPESSMTARWICAALTAAFLAAIVLACGSHGSRAAATETAIFAGGCFWCMEAAFDEVNAYRSVVFVANDEEKRLAEKTKEEIAARYKQKVATAIKPVTTFTAAEDYHQDYHNQNPVSYKYYKWGCGRAQRLAQIWGKPS